MLHILKHGDDNFPSPAAGLLLGLDIKGVLEVTYVIPQPAAATAKADNSNSANFASGDNGEGSDDGVEEEVCLASLSTVCLLSF